MSETAKYKAIETVYNNYRFRSRLEARWAVFFDSLGIEYLYEPEGFDLDGLRYLPDFYIPKWGVWIEIKPDVPTWEEREKAIRLCVAKEIGVVILAGDVWWDITGYGFNTTWGLTRAEMLKEPRTTGKGYWLSTTEYVSCDSSGYVSGTDLKRGYHWSPARWRGCSECNGAMLNSVAFLPCTCKKLTVAPFAESTGLLAAYTAARQARFEYGEKGRSEAMS